MGYIHIYYGDGKGKTTAVLGLALRASGAGMKILLCQFLKGSDTSELNALKKLENITVKRLDKDYGFIINMDESNKKAVTEKHNKMLNYAIEGEYDMVILDEMTDAYSLGLIDKEKVREFLSRDNSAEIVITGHRPDNFFIDVADYASEIHSIKNPYEKHISARKGIEF